MQSKIQNNEGITEDPESLKRVFDGAFAEISRAREIFTPEMTPRKSARYAASLPESQGYRDFAA